MSKLVIFEGCDGVGKSTQAGLIAEKLGANILVQPNRGGILGFLRDQVKHRHDYSALERQLLHTVTHVVDAFTVLDGKNNLVMDRSPLSALVYGEAMGLTPDQIDLLTKLNLAVYREVIDQAEYQVTVVWMLGKSHREKDHSIYEQNVSREELKRIYMRMYHDVAWTERLYYFHPKERHILVDPPLNMSVMEVSRIIERRLV